MAKQTEFTFNEASVDEMFTQDVLAMWNKEIVPNASNQEALSYLHETVKELVRQFDSVQTEDSEFRINGKRGRKGDSPKSAPTSIKDILARKGK